MKSSDAWASITCAHTPNVVPPAMPKLGSTYAFASSVNASSCAPVSPWPPNSLGQVIAREPGLVQPPLLRPLGVDLFLGELVLPRSEPAAAIASAVLRSQFAASHSRAP